MKIMVKEDLPRACFLQYPDRMLTGLFLRDLLALFFSALETSTSHFTRTALTAIFYCMTDITSPIRKLGLRCFDGDFLLG